MKGSLNLLYVHSESIGYGRLGVHLAQELEKMGLDVYDDLPGNLGPSSDLEMEHLANVGRGLRTGIGPIAAWVSVPTHARGWWKGQYPVIFSMWEAMTLPESFRETLHEFELVIVPSKQNVELFSQYHHNVRYNPLGVDPAVWHYKARRPPGTFFDFLIAGSGPRKGSDLAYAAFRKLWGRDGSWPSDGPIPRLVLKNPRNEDFYGDRIQMVAGRMSLDAEVALYETAHCYVQPSRGEGFGLQPLQAIAQGCPTILTNAHGHEAYAHLGYGISSKPTKAAYFIYGDAGEWWEPDLDELCDQMKYVYNNWDAAAEKAKFSAQQVLTERFTWSQCAQRFVDIIGPEKFQEELQPNEWYKPTQKLYKIVTNRDWHCEIAGASFQFHQGERYFEVADVKRILFEAGLLDLSCLGDEDSGLLPEQAARLPEYTARFSYCQLCHQRLGGPTKADELEGNYALAQNPGP